MTVSESSDSSYDESGMDIDDARSSFKDKYSLIEIGDMVEMCKSKCGTKYLSTLLYMSLRFFDSKSVILFRKL